jgi:hypothetical protein
MILEEARKICNEIIEKYGITYSTCYEERAEGEIKFIFLTLKFRIEKDSVTIQEKGRGNPDFSREVGHKQRKDPNIYR